MVCAGSLLTFAHTPAPIAETSLDHKAHFTAKVISNKETDYGCRLRLRIFEADSTACAPQEAEATIFRHDFCPAVGSTIEGMGKISFIPQNLALPDTADDKEIQRTIYLISLKRQGVNYTILPQSKSLKIIQTPNSYHTWVGKLRDAMWNGIALSPIDGKCASFLLAAILGDRSFLVPSEYENFRMTGTAHVLALSGLHVGIIVSLFGLLCIPLRALRRGYRYSYPVIILFVWIYAIITGMSASVSRSAIMLTLMMLGILLQRGSYPFNALCLAAIAILAFQPFQLFTPGFQLSFSSVLTLLIFARLIPERLQRRPILYYGAMAIVVPVAAMLGTGLISAYYFHTFPWFFLPTNIIVGLLIGPVLGIGFVLMIFTMMGISVGWLGWIEDRLYYCLDWGVKLFGNLSGSMETGDFSAWAFIPYSLFLIFLGLAIYRGKHDQPLVPAVILAGLALLLCVAIMVWL